MVASKSPVKRITAALGALNVADGPISRLEAARQLREAAEELEAAQVEAARKAGATWNEIGACYGLTKQGAQQRFRAARNQAKVGSGHSSGPWPLVRRDQGPLPQLRPPGIVVAAGVLAAITEEVALAGQDLETRCLSGSAEYGRLAGEAASRHEAKGLWQDDLHLAYGLGRAAD